MSEIQRTDAKSPFDAIMLPGERWSARAMMSPLGYPRWNEFESVIERAKAAARNQGFDVDDLFRVNTEKSGGRPALDYHLSRFACYLVAMNGDPRKPEVAAAQAYFAIKTREAETAAPAIPADYPSALEEAAKQARRAAELAAKVEADAPKVLYVETYVTDSDLLSFSTVASTNNITEKALRELLIEKDWIYAQTDSRWSESKQRKVIRNRYSEKADKKRHFRRVETHEAPRFRGSEIMHTLKVTPYGAEAIARLIAKDGAA